MVLFDKILIANRGEIALRIIRSAKKLAIKTVAIYSSAEREADYVKLADEAVDLGSDELAATFLNIEKIIQIAISTGASAIHPGYGFLSEHPGFAKACEDNHLVFIGPGSDVLQLMGNKPAAKSLADSLGIPTVLSRKIDLQSPDIDDKQLKFPVLIKASYGGGGKGMEIVYNHEVLTRQIEKSTRIALSYFGNGELFIEQYVRNARHVEVQIIGDNYNNIIHLYERDCTIQRNHQKIIEEAPATWLNPELRHEILAAALKIGKAVNYSGAGTVEFLIDEMGNFFFMEMNPRIQVEHAVTEEITGIDIVSEQLRIASGFPLSFSQDQVQVNGYAIELRIYAENPLPNFAPSTLPVNAFNLPKHSNIRIETDLNINHQVTNQFDPLLTKLIAFGKDRKSVVQLLESEIKNLNIIGPETNTKYLRAILAHPDYLLNNTTVEFCSNNHKSLINSYLNPLRTFHLPFLIAFSLQSEYFELNQSVSSDIWNYLGYWRLTPKIISLSVDGVIFNAELNLNNRLKPSFEFNGSEISFQARNKPENQTSMTIGGITKQLSHITGNQNNIIISCENQQYSIAFPGLLKSYPETAIESDSRSNFETGEIKSPLHGKVLEINVEKNQIIKKGDLMMVIEAMKSENRILSPQNAKVKNIAVNVGAQVTDQMPLLFLEEIL
jgi:acetyl/propionyl-CoA carboxylase alpha subunit